MMTSTRWMTPRRAIGAVFLAVAAAAFAAFASAATNDGSSSDAWEIGSGSTDGVTW